jgi:hypothetical protein
MISALGAIFYLWITGIYLSTESVNYLLQEGVLGREFGRKANHTYLINLITPRPLGVYTNSAFEYTNSFRDDILSCSRKGNV